MNMKKILFVLILCLVSMLGTAQSIFKRGIAVGTTDSIAPIDSIIRDGTIYKMYSNGGRLTESDIINDTIEARIAAAEEGVEIAYYDAGPVKHSDLPIGQNDTINNIYYVSNDGDDDNTGLTPASSWAHHPWMSTYTGSTTLEAGDVVCMKRGDSWTVATPTEHYMTVGQSGSVCNYIITTAYGVGAKPIIQITTAHTYSTIYASDKSYLIFNNLHIKHYSSTYDGFRRDGILLDGTTSACHDIIITNCEFSSIPLAAIEGYIDCYNIIIGDTLATKIADSINYSNHIYDFGYAGIRLLGCDPVTEESNFKIYYNYIHDCTQIGSGELSYGVSFDIHASSTAWPKYCYIKYNNIQDIPSWTGLDCHGGSYIYITDNYIKNFGLAGIAVLETTTGVVTDAGDSVFVENNIIEQPASGWTTGAEQAFIIVTNQSDASDMTNIFVRNNIIRFSDRPAGANLFSGIRIRAFNGSCEDIFINDNEIYDGSTTSNYPAIYLYPDGSGYSDITISGNYINNWNGTSIRSYGAYIVGDIIITNNILTTGDGSYALYISNSNVSATGNIYIYNNVLLSGADDYVYYLHGMTAGSTLTFKNNIMGFTSSQNKAYMYLENVPAGTLVADYNAYWNSSNATPFDLGAGTMTLANYQIAGYEINTPNGDEDDDPLFKNAGGSYLLETDFDLQTTSPCINAGVDVAIDYLGTAPDIGYIEKR